MLFGIDLVMIDPGFVNTTMCDKGEKEDLSEFKPTEYWNSVIDEVLLQAPKILPLGRAAPQFCAPARPWDCAS
jgi:hypothetical protein